MATIERAQELAERLLSEPTPQRRMLVIVNPYATTVSDRLRNLVVYALQSRYTVEAIDTEKRGHATQLCREAVVGGAELDSGDLSLAALKRATPPELATLTARLLSGRARVVQGHRHIAGLEGVKEAVIEGVGGEPFPLQVDGDYIGERTRAEYGVAAAGLSVVS